MTKWFLSPLLAVAAMSPSAALADELFSFVVNPLTGSVDLRNDSGATQQIDGYLLEGDAPGVFNPSGLNRIGSSSGGWSDGQITGDVLSEVNLLGSTAIPAGGAISLGTAYTPVSTSLPIGTDEPEFSATVSIAGVSVVPADLEFSIDNSLVLVVDPKLGLASLENQSSFAISLDSYTIQSGAAVLAPQAGRWASLESSIGGGWQASPGDPSFLSEINLGATVVPAGGSLDLGRPVDPSLLSQGASLDELDLSLGYSIAAGGGLTGPAGLTGSVLFRASDVLAGDFNDDGSVDAADYTVWRDGLPLANEISTVGSATQEDYDDWVANFGAVAAPPAAFATPEPTTLTALLLAVALHGVAARNGVRAD